MVIETSAGFGMLVGKQKQNFVYGSWLYGAVKKSGIDFFLRGESENGIFI